MAQCNAATAKGTRCVSSLTAPAKSLCGKHQNALARGTEVRNFASGRKFPVSRQ